jgi:type II secretion system protein H
MMLLIGQNKPKRDRAFTLIELILVMVLLLVAVSMMAPNLSGFIRGRSLDSEARRMMALMHAAQSRAISEGMPVIFWVNGKLGQYGVTEETPAAASGDPNAEVVSAADNLQISVLNAGVNATTTFHNLPAIRFLADGSVDEDSPQTLRITSADGGSLWLAEMKSRTGYEVRDTPN